MTPANQQIYRWKFVINVAVRAVILFTLMNILFALIYPLDVFGNLSVYNWLLPGRDRLPYGENSASYNLSLYDLNAMFSSHVIAAPRKPDEFHVVVVGDSSVWGVQLDNRNTLTGQINAQDLHIGRRHCRYSRNTL